MTRLRSDVGSAAQELDALLDPHQAGAFTAGGPTAGCLGVEADAIVAYR